MTGDQKEAYGFNRLIREYATFCVVGTFNLAIFFLMYVASYSMFEGLSLIHI